MLTQTKLRLTYITIGTYFFFGGIEYAVILPTIWLYLSTVFHAPPYLLGIVLSSFSVADLLSGLLLGRLSDKTQQTKLLLILTNVFQIVGSFLYIVDVGPEMLVISRLVTGFGSGISAPLIGDLARVIPDAQRTSTLSAFFALRQAGLVLGPACNLFLTRFDFFFATYHVNKYTSPGFFMMVLWIVHEMMAIFMFWNLPSLNLNEPLIVDIICSNGTNIQHCDPTSGLSTSVESGINNVDQQNESEITASESDTKQNTSIAMSKEIMDDIPDSVDGKIMGKSKSCARKTTHQKTGHRVPSDDVTCGSDDFMEKAELLIKLNTALRCHPSLIPSTSKNRGLKPQDSIFPAISGSGGTISESRDAPAMHNQSPQPSSQTCTNKVDDISTEATLLLSNSANLDYETAGCSGNVENPEGTRKNRLPRSHPDSVVGDFSINGLALHHGDDDNDNDGGDNEPNQGQAKLSLSRELFKSYLIALLLAVFIGYFNQMVLEALLTPLTREFLSWNELENSYLYCAAGVQITLMFLLIRSISRVLEDKFLIVIGLLLQLVSITLLLGYVPWATKDKKLENLVVFMVAVFINLVGLPMLVVCSNSLFTRLVPSEIQGFSQGVRKLFCGVGTILGPLWAGGTIGNPLALFSVMVGITFIALVLLLASFQELTPLSLLQVTEDLIQTRSSLDSSPSLINNDASDNETAPLTSKQC